MNQIDLREVIESKESFLKRLYFVLVGKGYRDDRYGVTRIPINDTLEVQFKLDVSDILVDSSICVLDNLIERVGVSRKNLIGYSVENTQRLFPAKLQSFSEIFQIFIDEDLPMYVLTNEKQNFGAGAILYPGMKQKIEETMGEFIILPSSIHELILIPESMNKPELKEIIYEVNRTVVNDSEILSDRPYRLIEDMVLEEA